MFTEIMDRIQKQDVLQLNNEKEFAFCIGQLWSYLLTQSESSSKNYDLLLPVLQADKIDRIKALTTNLVKKYAHSVSINNKRFNALLSATLSFEQNEKFKSQDFIIAGFAMKNIVYTKQGEN